MNTPLDELKYTIESYEEWKTKNPNSADSEFLDRLKSLFLKGYISESIFDAMSKVLGVPMKKPTTSIPRATTSSAGPSGNGCYTPPTRSSC